jgi:transketolase C-terminal domain/subunit
MLREGDDIALLANGVLVARALEAAEKLHGAGLRRGC